MALRRKMIHLVRLRLVHQARQAAPVRHVAIVQEELHPRRVRVLIQMVDTLRIETRRTADQAMHLIPLLQQQLGQIRPVLSRDTRDKCNLAHDNPFYYSQSSHTSPIIHNSPTRTQKSKGTAILSGKCMMCLRTLKRTCHEEREEDHPALGGGARGLKRTI